MPAFFSWGVAVAISVGLLFVATRATTIEIIRKIVVPLAAPLFVLVMAGIMLFGTAQGQDLGVGLLGQPRGVLFLLFLALLYWATGSWHAARLGLNRAWGSDPRKYDGYAMLLRWLPRLIGASAHLFAAISIALAVSSVLPSEAPPLYKTILALMGPLAIVLGTFLAWLQDRQYVRTRDAIEAGRKADAAARAAAEAELKAARWRARRAVLLLALAAVGIAVGMLVLEARLLGRSPWQPSGLVVAQAMSWVLASAAVFLLIVSYRRSIEDWLGRSILGRLGEGLQGFFDEDSGVATSSVVLAVILSAIAFAMAGWALLDPHGLGELAGSVVIAFFAFGAYIAVIDLARILLKTRARFSAAVAVLLLVVVFNSVGQTFHRVRLCGDPLAACGGPPTLTTATAQPWIDPRPTVEMAAKAWYEQVKEEWPAGEPVPMLIVATAGGGIRASVWTATVLDRLAAEMGGDRLRRHLFAISGVSGGSVGAAFFAASLARGERPAEEGDDRGPTARMLGRDFLAPTLATFAFVDLPSSILPEHAFGDRSWTLEYAWELASGGTLSQPFLTLGARADGRPGPLLLLNATHQATGKRIIASQVRIERRVFLDAFDMHTLLGADMPASTAAHNSARFTYVSPAGRLESRRDADGDKRPDDIGYVLDGGYFENFGALTALQLARAAKRTLGHRVRPVLLLISSDPAMSARDRAGVGSICTKIPKNTNWPLRYDANVDGGGFSRYLNQLTAPAAGLMSSREAHGIVATKELAASACDSARSRSGASAVGTAKPMAGGVPGAAPAAFRMVKRTDGAGAAPVDAGPLFIHFRMCEEDGVALPPLGWVLSDAVQQKFPELLKTHCRNRDEWGRLARATDSPMSDWWNTPPARDGTALAEALAK